MKTLIKIRGYVGKRAYLVCFESDEKLRRYRMKCNQICLTLSNPRIHKSSHKDWQKAFNIKILDNSVYIDFKRWYGSLWVNDLSDNYKDYDSCIIFQGLD